MTDEDAMMLNAMYWAEEDEIKMGIHPSQVIDRMEEAGYTLPKDCYLNWPGNGIVEVWNSPKKDTLLKKFDYIKNILS